MSFNNRNYYELREAFEKKHLEAAERAEARRAELAARVEGVREIDAALAETASRILGAALAGKEGLDAPKAVQPLSVNCQDVNTVAPPALR